MSELDTAHNIWLLYGAAAIALLAIVLRLMQKVLSVKPLLLLMGTLALLLLTPAAVPGTESLAPAWLIALFELAQGRTASGAIALKPLLFLLGTFCSIFLLVWIIRFRQSRASIKSA